MKSSTNAHITSSESARPRGKQESHLQRCFLEDLENCQKCHEIVFCPLIWEKQLCYIMPSSSARCAQFPRAQDQVDYYIKLKDLRDQLKGIAANTAVQEVQYTFDLQLAQEDAKKMAVKEEKYDPGYKTAYGGAYCDRAPHGSKQCHFSSNGTAIDPQWDHPTVKGHSLVKFLTDKG
ncbi:hypothetical protein AV530_002575 [Patagioenas fasciata monilis]|uniref:Uncharacterized protein n=1 Tax=Patagioenas fasciata monilis TaxID=372326 RepID=A0A1V4K733_PATFA|nr:hypothetical protein AV530_002575 [Patagioenas fasciata monilis]